MVFNLVYNNDGSIEDVLAAFGAVVTIGGIATAGLASLIGALITYSGATLRGISSAYLKMYESTYANEPAGNKYL